MKALFISVIFVCLFSCYNDKQTGVITVTDFSKELSLSEVISDIDIVALQTDSFALGEISDLCFCDSVVYVVDKLSGSISSFNKKNGRNITFITQSGLGPNEYVDPIAIDCRMEEIFVLDRANKIIVYDRDLNPIKTIKLENMPFDFVATNDGFVIRNEMGCSYKFSCLNKNGREKAQFIPITSNNDAGKSCIGGYTELAFFDDTVYVCDGARSEFYLINNNNIDSIIKFDFADYTIPENINRNNYEGEFQFIDKERFFVTDDFIILNYFIPKNYQSHYTFYNKKTKVLISGYFEPLDSVMPFFPRSRDGNSLVGFNYYCILEENTAFRDAVAKKYPNTYFDAETFFLIYYFIK
jgi:hypothetical protein